MLIRVTSCMTLQASDRHLLKLSDSIVKYLTNKAIHNKRYSNCDVDNSLGIRFMHNELYNYGGRILCDHCMDTIFD